MFCPFGTTIAVRSRTPLAGTETSYSIHSEAAGTEVAAIANRILTAVMFRLATLMLSVAYAPETV